MSRVKKGAKKRSAKKTSPSPRVKPSPPSFTVKPLDAQRICGAATSVQQLFRVDELTDGVRIAHLVFDDRRHGWYCAHGADCRAVAAARRSGTRGSTKHGPTHNGRMRA